MQEPSERIDNHTSTDKDSTICKVIVLVVVSIILWRVLIAIGYNVVDQSYILDTASDFATIIAIITGGFWTYRIFVRQRLAHPHLNIDQEIICLDLDDGSHLLKVFAKLENVGLVRIDLRLWKLRAEQLLPLTGKMQSFIHKRTAFSERDSEWKTIAGKDDGTFSGDAFIKKLEPGEIDRAIGNLVIPSGVDVIQIYSHFQTDVICSRKTYGWPIQTVVDLRRDCYNELRGKDNSMSPENVRIITEEDVERTSDDNATKAEPWRPPSDDDNGNNSEDSGNDGSENDSSSEE